LPTPCPAVLLSSCPCSCRFHHLFCHQHPTRPLLLQPLPGSLRQLLLHHQVVLWQLVGGQPRFCAAADRSPFGAACSQRISTTVCFSTSVCAPKGATDPTLNA
jgi:hypothetical protein